MAKKRSRKYLEALEQVDRHKEYDALEAIELVKEIAFTNFDSMIEVAYRLGVNPKHADQQLRGALVLPNGTGKDQTVAVFAKDNKADEARQAGADFVGAEDLVEKIEAGWLDFDVIVASPDMMAQVGRLGRILGPKGLMPNPKTGTVTADVAEAVKNIKNGQVTYRVDNQSNLHVTVGKTSFDAKALLENLQAIHETVLREKPASAKGVYIQNVAIASTMGPGVKLDKNSIV